MIVKGPTGAVYAKAKIAGQKPCIRWSEHDQQAYAEIDVDGIKVLIDTAEFAALSSWFLPRRCHVNEPGLPPQKV